MNRSQGKWRDGVSSPTTNFVLSAVCVAAMASVAFNAQAGMDVFAPPPVTDSSHQTDQPADPTQALQDLFLLPEANEGSLETTGGVFLPSRGAIDINNVVQRDALAPFNYP